MDCPFCAESVSNDALVCKFCRHDLTYVKRLQADLREQARRIAELEQALASARQAGGEAAGDADPMPRAGAVSAQPAAAQGNWQIAVMALAGAAVLVVALLGTQYACVIWLDLPVLLLRALLILIPLAWGFFYPWFRLARLGVIAAIALAAGIASVVGMLAIVAHIDGVPVLPADRRERVEAIQVIASIALGLGCGVLLARAVATVRAQSARMRAGYASAVSMVRDSTKEPARLGASAEAMQKLAEFAAPFLSGAGAILAAVLSLLR